mmetsp:Transcript_99640/g.287641  ORF Transcript_99640/g.287641 Transcript_99640/m.287641 type:complete len:271 (-) Transcript_99640:763-1575(-)
MLLPHRLRRRLLLLQRREFLRRKLLAVRLLRRQTVVVKGSVLRSVGAAAEHCLGVHKALWLLWRRRGLLRRGLRLLRRHPFPDGRVRLRQGHQPLDDFGLHMVEAPGLEAFEPLREGLVLSTSQVDGGRGHRLDLVCPNRARGVLGESPHEHLHFLLRLPGRRPKVGDVLGVLDLGSHLQVLSPRLVEEPIAILRPILMVLVPRLLADAEVLPQLCDLLLTQRVAFGIGLREALRVMVRVALTEDLARRRGQRLRRLRHLLHLFRLPLAL